MLMTRGGVKGEAQARALLRTGAAGWGTVTDTGVLFDDEAVKALADRPWLSESAQEETCPDGVYLARLARSVPLDLTRPWAEVVAGLERLPSMPPLTTALLSVSVSVAGRLPWVATYHGFVVVGADLVGLRTDATGTTTFRLEPPGDWFEAWRETRVRLSRGGRPWVIRQPRAA
jgi:hypothetical protein